MAESTIQWTDMTWNPTTGCDRVSPGCANCYAVPQAKRNQAMARALGKHVAPTDPYMRDGDPRTSGPGFGLMVHESRLYLPLGWAKPKRVFVNSMSDLFHPEVSDGFIARVWDVMGRAPWHTFQVLTKRPERMREWASRWADTTGDDLVDPIRGQSRERGPGATRARYSSGRAHLFAAMLEDMGAPPESAAYPTYDWMEGQRYWPRTLPNVWLGTSVENARWRTRIDELRETPAAVRFLSCEPLLGPLDLSGRLADPCHVCEHFPGQVALDDQVRLDRTEQRDDVAMPAHPPGADRLPSASRAILPAGDSSNRGDEPFHELGGGAVDGDPGAVRPARSAPPVEVALPVEETGNVPEHAGIGGNADRLLAERRSLPSHRDTGLDQAPADGPPARAEGPRDRRHRLAGFVGTGDVCGCDCHSSHAVNDSVAWVIVGGESGPRSRPMDERWVRDVVDTCRRQGAAAFVKQLGAVWSREHLGRGGHGGDIEEWPEDLRIREFPARVAA
jgi:protein gp37